jgi:membrane protease YdiL (CAAX protease family)
MAMIWRYAVALWQALPVVLRAVIVVELVVDVGGLPPDLFVFGNLKLLPWVPWCLPLAGLWLWGFWRYLGGQGWPRANGATRRELLRASPLPARIWVWALIAGGLGMLCVVGVSFLTLRLADLPADAYRLPVDLSRYPLWTVVAGLLVISLTAGVVEEAGYRGYMLSMLERRHGWVAAVLLTGFMFFLDHHLSHAYATWAFLPFFMLVSALHGLLVYCTRSILPSVLLHAVADFLVIPVQFGLVGHLDFTPVWKTGVDPMFMGIVALVVLAGATAVPAFRRLATVTRDRR